MASLKYPSLVLDASSVVWIMEGSPEAAAFQQAVLEAELVLAPELMLTEASNGRWRLQRTGQLQADGLQLYLSQTAALVDHIEPDRHLQVEALARREAVVLLTADPKLMALAKQVLP